MKKKYLRSIWFLKSKPIQKEKINHFSVYNLNTTTILNIYNLLNNIKFTKKSEKNLHSSWFFETKVLYKKKKVKSLHSSQFKYKLLS